jgi:hypothetical protein
MSQTYYFFWTNSQLCIALNVKKRLCIAMHSFYFWMCCWASCPVVGLCKVRGDEEHSPSDVDWTVERLLPPSEVTTITSGEPDPNVEVSTCSIELLWAKCHKSWNFVGGYPRSILHHLETGGRGGGSCPLCLSKPIFCTFIIYKSCFPSIVYIDECIVPFQPMYQANNIFCE